MSECPTKTALRVLYVLSSEHVGDEQIAVLRTLSEPDAVGITPLVVCPGRGAITQELDRREIPHEELKLEDAAGPGPRPFAAGVWHLAWLIRSRNMDVVHSLSLDTAQHCFVAARLAGSRIVCHVTRGSYNETAGGLLRQTIERFDGITADSDDTRAGFCELFQIPITNIEVAGETLRQGADQFGKLYRRVCSDD